MSIDTSFKMLEFTNKLDDIVGNGGSDTPTSTNPTPTDSENTPKASPRPIPSPLSQKRFDPTYRSLRMNGITLAAIQLLPQILSVYDDCAPNQANSALKSELNQALGNVMEAQEKVLKEGLKTPITFETKHFAIAITSATRAFFIAKKHSHSSSTDEGLKSEKLDYKTAFKLSSSGFVLKLDKLSDRKLVVVKGIFGP